MLQQQVHFLTTILMILDGMAVIAAGYGAFLFRHWESGDQWDIDTQVFTGSVLIIMFVNNYMIGKFGLYNDRRSQSHAMLMWSVAKALAISFGALAVGIYLSQEKMYSRLFFVCFALLCFVLVAVVRILFQLYLDKVARDNPYSRKILVVGSPERGRCVMDLLKGQLSLGHEVIGLVSLESTVKGGLGAISSCEDMEKIIREKTIDEIIFAIDGDRTMSLSQYIALCKKTGVSCRILPAMWNPSESALSIESLQGVPFLTFRSTCFNATGLIYKRVLDMAGGLVGCFIFVLIYPFVAAAIKLDSPGPVIFKQQRVGEHGRLFQLCKFRTMYRNAEHRLKELMAANEMNGAMFKIKDDPRITRVGRWLRITSLDEIPQFWNVLKGEMSLVGTRPPTLNEVETYRTDHLKRIAAKPGITGMWQVSGRNKIKDFETVVELDCRYMENWSFCTDLKILFKTFIVVLQRKGAV
jgi:exopolysaccharide biosynthesis polyprenyl glycosylphosphotransferase